MVRNPEHEMLSPPTHDERLRQQFVFSLKRHIGTKVRPGNRTIFEKVAKPAFEKKRRPPARNDIRDRGHHVATTGVSIVFCTQQIGPGDDVGFGR